MAYTAFLRLMIGDREESLGILDGAVELFLEPGHAPRRL